MKIYGNALSTNAMRVLACAYEKEVDFEFVAVDMRAGDHKKDHFLALNPFGQVPAMEDGDLKLFESRAISKYIAQKYSDKGTPLLEKGSKNEAIVTLWMEVEAHQFDATAGKLCLEIVFKPMFGMSTDTAAVKEFQEKLDKVLDVYEKRLSKSKYLASDNFTLADLHHLPILRYLMGTEMKKLVDSRPKVSAWVANITARPAWGKVLALQCS